MPKKKSSPRPTSKRTAKSRARTSSEVPTSAEAEAAAMEQFTRSTPRPVLETLFPKGAKIGGKKVHPLTLASHCFLSDLGNPAMEPGGLTDISNYALMELCVVLTHPLRELVDLRDELVVGDDDSEWRKWVLLECDEIPLEEIFHIGRVVGAVINQATQTMVPTQPKKKAKNS